MEEAVRRLGKGIYRRGRIYWLSIQRDGKRTFLSLETDDPLEATRKAEEIRRGDAIESGSILTHAVDRFVKHQCEQGIWTRHTKDSKGYVLKQWANEMGPLLPQDVTPDRIGAWYERRKANHTIRTAHGNLMTVRSFFNWCCDIERTVRENPVTKYIRTRRIRAPKPAARQDFCTPAQRDHIITSAEGNDELQFILFAGFHAGMRFNEIVEARPFWFDLGARLLHLRKTPTIEFKDKEERTIPLTSQFAAFLEGYGLREPFMLRPEKLHGKDRYRFDFGPMFRKHVEACGLGWVTPHIMRHTFASLLVSAGVSIYKVAVWLGDDVRVVQRHYGKLIPQDTDIERGISHYQQTTSQSGRMPDPARAGHRA